MKNQQVKKSPHPPFTIGKGGDQIADSLLLLANCNANENRYFPKARGHVCLTVSSLEAERKFRMETAMKRNHVEQTIGSSTNKFSTGLASHRFINLFYRADESPFAAIL